MKRLALLLIATVVLSVYVYGAAGDTPLTGKITLTAIAMEHNVQGVFPGAMETWRYSLTSIRRNPARPFGYMVLSCARIQAENTLRQCVGTASLPRGKITVSGSFLYAQLWTLAVTGGTDDYAGATGTATSIQTHKSKTVFVLTFNLT